ncbi:TniQ family protein [Bosea sp. 2KB_26]|uniref:TniQ family protein n=1 Tax=Bosea sp. 2KB_26 TaxID=3237475 RepID=UPI003F8DE748
MRLYPVTPFIDGETPASYASRLAILNGVTAEIFCKDFRIGLDGLLRGEPDNVCRLAELAGEEANKLIASAWRTEAEFSYFRGHTFGVNYLRREGGRACLRCLQDDRVAPDLPPGAGIRYRGHWRLTNLRTCHLHKTPIVTLPPPDETGLRRDFARRVAIQFDDLDFSTPHRVPSRLETYILSRLYNQPHAPCWLDTLPLYAAANSCEAIGATSVFGIRHNRKKLNDDEWWLAGSRGYEIASGGAVAIDAFLTELRLGASDRCHRPGPYSWFGALYKWLLGEKGADPVYDPLRSIMTLNLVETAAFSSNITVFGKPLPDRKVHSVRSAAQETGIHPRFIRRVLDATGIAGGSIEEKSDTEVTFDVTASADAFRRLASALHIREVGPYAGCSLRISRMLVREGFIPPILHSSGRANGISRYAREDVDSFLTRLSVGSEVLDEAPLGAHPIAMAPRHVPCEVSVVVNLLLKGELAWSGRLARARGLDGILIDVREVRKKVIDPRLGDFTIHQAYPLLGVNSGAIYALARAGLIELLPIKQPPNRRSLPRITFDQIMDFRRTFVSMTEAARQLSKNLHQLRAGFAAAGIRPLDLPTSLSLRLYKREDIAVLYPAIKEIANPLTLSKDHRDQTVHRKRNKTKDTARLEDLTIHLDPT